MEKDFEHFENKIGGIGSAGFNENFIPIRREKNMRKKIQRIVEKRKKGDQFTTFDKLGKPIAKIEKELPQFLVVEKYFKNIPRNIPINALDVDSESRIWGCLLAKTYNQSTVSLLSERDDQEELERIHSVIDANDIINAHIIDNNDLDDMENKKYNLILLQHEWAENESSIYNKIVRFWDKLAIGGRILIISHKKRGAKSLIRFFTDRKISCEIVGRGRGGVRLIELEKTIDNNLEPIETRKSIKFTFNNKEYTALVDDGVFSKQGLDDGTKYLLDTIISAKVDMNNKKIGDLGSGWGVISIILLNEFSDIQITAYENNKTAVELSKLNLNSYQRTNVKEVDLTKKHPQILNEDHSEFDYLVSNPPFHITEKERIGIIKNARSLLKKGGEIFFVIEESFKERFKQTASSLLTFVGEDTNGKYTVFRYRK